MNYWNTYVIVFTAQFDLATMELFKTQKAAEKAMEALPKINLRGKEMKMRVTGLHDFVESQKRDAYNRGGEDEMVDYYDR